MIREGQRPMWLKWKPLKKGHDVHFCLGCWRSLNYRDGSSAPPMKQISTMFQCHMCICKMIAM
jgi:hypothetical protein